MEIPLELQRLVVPIIGETLQPHIKTDMETQSVLQPRDNLITGEILKPNKRVIIQTQQFGLGNNTPLKLKCQQNNMIR